MIAAAVIVGLAIVLLPFFGRGALAWWARQQAAHHLDRGAITATQLWLRRAARLDPEDGRTDLLRAACFRRLHQVEQFTDALEAARRKGAPEASVQHQVALGQIHAGRLSERPELQLMGLIEGGLPANEVAAAFVAGFLVRDEPEEARKVLDAWSADRPDEPDVAYMRGFYWHWLGELRRAETELETALTREPRHELARGLLAELLEEQDRVEDAYRQYQQWTSRFPTNETARVGLARTLRKAGHGEQARAVLQPIHSDSPSPELAAEIGQLELDGDNFNSALQWFGRLSADQLEHHNVANDAAMAMALAGKQLVADRLFTLSDAEIYRRRRLAELEGRAADGANEQQAVADESQDFRLRLPMVPTSSCC